MQSHGRILQGSTGGNLCSFFSQRKLLLQPWAQTIDLVRTEEGGCSKGTGLITPIRSRQVLNCKFNTAYGYVEESVEAIEIENATNKQVELKKNTIVAEFHPKIGIRSRHYVAIGRMGKSIVECTTTIGMQHHQSATNQQHVS